MEHSTRGRKFPVFSGARIQERPCARAGRLLVTVAMMLALAACQRAPDPLPGLPKLFLWTADRAGTLEFVHANEAGIAFLARTVYLQDGQVASIARQNPLTPRPGVALIAVARVEQMGGALPDAADVAAEIAGAASQPVAPPALRALQVDYDARAGDRDFYRAVLKNLRARLPAPLPLEITAEVQWCNAGSWIHGLPVAAAVPMFFRGGNLLQAANEPLGEPLCGSDLGISADQARGKLPAHRRLFVAQPGAWTAEDFHTLQKALR